MIKSSRLPVSLKSNLHQINISTFLDIKYCSIIVESTRLCSSTYVIVVESCETTAQIRHENKKGEVHCIML